MEAIALTSYGSNLVQNFLKTELKRRFLTSPEWLPASPDCNPLDYFFWDAVKSRVYEQAVYEPRRIEGKNKSRLERYR